MNWELNSISTNKRQIIKTNKHNTPELTVDNKTNDIFLMRHKIKATRVITTEDKLVEIAIMTTWITYPITTAKILSITEINLQTATSKIRLNTTLELRIQSKKYCLLNLKIKTKVTCFPRYNRNQTKDKKHHKSTEKKSRKEPKENFINW